MDDPYNSEVENNMVRMVVMFLTMSSMYYLYKRNHYKVKWENEYFSNDRETRLYYRYKEVTSEKFDIYIPSHKKEINFWFVVEFIMQMITPIPYYDAYITVFCNQ